MRKIMIRVGLVLALFLAGFSVSVAPEAPPAQASKLCTWAKFCGNIEMQGSYALRVDKDWGGSMWDRYLYPGQGTKRTFGWVDVDGFWLPANSCASTRHVNGIVRHYGSKWNGTYVKLNDLFAGTAITYFCASAGR